jgi:hypothetical protein
MSASLMVVTALKMTWSLDKADPGPYELQNPSPLCSILGSIVVTGPDAAVVDGHTFAAGSNIDNLRIPPGGSIQLQWASGGASGFVYGTANFTIVIPS